MAYVILIDSTKSNGEKVALINRTKYKDQWWTQDIAKAVVFTSIEQAEMQCSKLKFGNPKVYTKENGEKRLGQVRIAKSKSWFGEALDEKASQWHDDDWDEGTNA